MADFVNFTKGEVVIYEGYMEDVLCLFDYEDGDFVYLNELNGQPYRSTVFNRIRRASVDDLKSEICELRYRLETLKKGLELM